MSEKEKEEECSEAKAKNKKIKVCRGGLYHSSTRKSNSKDPFCLGFTKTFHHDLGVKDKLESVSETERRNYNISYFKYGCIGFSAHLDKDHPWMKRRDEPAYCFGFELIIRNWSNRAPAHSNQEVQSSQSQSAESSSSVEPATSSSYDFQKRLARNLAVVASGVGKSAVSVGSHIKNRFKAIYPFGKRDD